MIKEIEFINDKEIKLFNAKFIFTYPDKDWYKEYMLMIISLYPWNIWFI